MKNKILRKSANFGQKSKSKTILESEKDSALDGPKKKFEKIWKKFEKILKEVGKNWKNYGKIEKFEKILKIF